MTPPSNPDAAVRKTAADTLRAVAIALYAASTVLFVLMIVVWFSSAWDLGHRDWPGRYWFAVLPMLTAAASLTVSANRIHPLPTKPSPRYDSSDQ